WSTMLPALLLLLGAAVLRGADTLPDQNLLLLPPVNLTIVVAGLARALLRWAPHPDQARQNVTVDYHVRIHGPQEDEYETRSTVSTCVAPLHQGLSASVRAIVRDHGRLQAASRWVSAELEPPPGPPGTAAVNLTCTTNTAAGDGTHAASYQVSLHCAWRAGEAAPADTQYFLYYRFGAETHECREYSRDSLQRNIACWFPRTSIHSKRRDRLAVLVNGSSRLTAIRPLDRLFALHAIDQVNPPRNVTAKVQGARLSIEWQKPVSAFPSHCFDYEVQISDTRKAYVQTEKRTVNAFTSVIDNSSRYCVQARATVSTTCRAAGLWSSWSPPFCV
uniref:Type I cytokine receptor cytokine-binding domain-containing protein n=1 Tax=Oryctolagus cuniculus TaxID=9986 RepID=G1T9S8_RABIT